MYVQLLKKSKYELMPWKNGLGETAQIDISPPGAPFPSEGFHWRLSSARVAADTDFSQFPECERWLVVWQGEGLFLNDKKMLPNQPLHFSGDEPIHCRMVDGTVLDVGLIFRPTKVRAEFTVQQLAASEHADFATDGVVTYLFCAKGQVQVDKELLETGDSLKVIGGGSLSLSSAGGASYFLIKLFDA